MERAAVNPDEVTVEAFSKLEIGAKDELDIGRDGAKVEDRVDRSSRLEGCVGTGGSSVSRSIRFPLVFKFRVNLSPP